MALKSKEELRSRIRKSRADGLSFLADPGFLAPSVARLLRLVRTRPSGEAATWVPSSS